MIVDVKLVPLTIKSKCLINIVFFGIMKEGVRDLKYETREYRCYVDKYLMLIA